MAEHRDCPFPDLGSSVPKWEEGAWGQRSHPDLGLCLQSPSPLTACSEVT